MRSTSLGILLVAAVSTVVIFPVLDPAALAIDAAYTSTDNSFSDPNAEAKPGADGLPTSIHNGDLASVKVQCLTRTAGYWGNHPDVLGYFLTSSCGVEFLNSAQAIEDICFSGRDYKYNNTSEEQLQLIRQCAVANLNLEASEACDPLDVSRVIECCNDGRAVCNSGATPDEINGSGCIEDLKTFNRSTDTIDDVPWQFAANGGADSSVCKIKRGDGIVNAGRSLGPWR